jgi:chromosome segregation ATPase
LNLDNNTIKEIKAKYNDYMNQIESIKSRNAYIQKSLAELKSLIDKAKSLERTRDKDVAFKAYYENLEQIRNETISLQVNSAMTLKSINSLIQEGHQTLARSGKELNDLTAKVEDLLELYQDHDNKYLELKQKCNLAEQRTKEVSRLALNWQNKVQQAQKGSFLAFKPKF